MRASQHNGGAIGEFRHTPRHFRRADGIVELPEVVMRARLGEIGADDLGRDLRRKARKERQ
jgi:hypothetical protein